MAYSRATVGGATWPATRVTAVAISLTLARGSYGASRAADEINSTLDTLQVVGSFENVPAGHAVVGDSNHDGGNEILYRAVDSQANSFTRIVERTPAGQFVLAAQVPGLVPLAIGDADQDGRTDLIGKDGSLIRVYESPDESSYPTALVWEALSETNSNGRFAIADTDRDGRLEIIHEYYSNTIRMEIYECTGDNNYTLRFRFTNPHKPGASGSTDVTPADALASAQQPRGLLVDDLDGDGRPEIAFSDENGVLRVFESFADNSWTQTSTSTTGLINPRVVAGGEDADANGLKEIWLAGDDPVAFNRRIFIFEPTDQDSFTCVDTLTTVDGESGGQSGTLAHLDYEDRWRFVWNVGQRLEIYAHNNGQWQIEKIYNDPHPNHFEIRATDLNRNGRDEIVWLGNGVRTQSWILEEPTIASDAGPGFARHSAAILRIFPSPAHDSGTIVLDTALATQVRAWDVFDVSGRLVFSRHPADTRMVEPWRLPISHLRPGLYFVRATDGSGGALATGRVTVVR